MNLNFPFMAETFFKALQGIPVTMGITATSLFLAAPLAWLMAVLRLRQYPFFAAMAKGFVSIIRGTPIVLQILLIYSLLPGLLNTLVKGAGLTINVFSLNPIYYAFVVFAINSSAGLSEIFRSALITVPRGQLEAAHSLGFSTVQAYRQFVIPQAITSALPNLCNLTVNLIKASSLAFIMTVKDVTAIARIEASYGYDYIESYLVILFVYILLCSLTQLLFQLAERRAVQFKAA